MSDKRCEWTIMGRVVGTGTGWDQMDTSEIIIYDFVPAEGVDLPVGDLGFNSENGIFYVGDSQMDAVTVLIGVPRVNV